MANTSREKSGGWNSLVLGLTHELLDLPGRLVLPPLRVRPSKAENGQFGQKQRWLLGHFVHHFVCEQHSIGP
jgi:hypothetical protein